ncbi:hypothetical protein [Bacillus sp. UMB0728]|uniref:hypothetical protein n=1 Tax=Bacillus sp. UMB0728 TaxID=2066052 RepID=UPI000C787E87|nr:hypothetical protein [Bacillus sp. UMB0728]PLR73530.1 hypothetical protein CYJ37_08310 [Bacillus sp. UMB0728]
MFSIQYKRSFFSIREDIGVPPYNINIGNADIYLQQELLLSEPTKADTNLLKGSFRLVVPNYLINLEEEEEGIFQRIHKNTRYKIKRAMNRDELTYIELTHPKNEEIEKFSEFFNPFAKERNIRLCDVSKLMAIRDQRSLVISYVVSKNNQVLCYHVHHKEEEQGYLIYSASKRYEKSDSLERNLIGRANRYLHWKDILSFKEKGCKWYNFSGKVLNERDQGGQNVNKFKEEYGPTVGYDSRTFYATSIVGRIGLFFLYLKWKSSAEYKFTKETEVKKLIL